MAVGVCPPWTLASTLLYFALLESREMPKFDSCILFYRQFSVDIFCVCACLTLLILLLLLSRIKKTGRLLSFHRPDMDLNRSSLAISAWLQATSWILPSLYGATNSTSTASSLWKEQNLYLLSVPHLFHPKGCFTGPVQAKSMYPRWFSLMVSHLKSWKVPGRMEGDKRQIKSVGAHNREPGIFCGWQRRTSGATLGLILIVTGF